jgi:hypothetical protein
MRSGTKRVAQAAWDSAIRFRRGHPRFAPENLPHNLAEKREK